MHLVQSPYYTPLHMMRPKVQVPVCVRLFTICNIVEFTILLPCYLCIKEGERLHLHGEFYGWV